MEIISVLLIAGAISLDAFGVAIVYGIKKIKLPFKMILFISLSISLVIGSSILLGKLLSPFLSTNIQHMISFIILFCIGLGNLFNGWKSKKISQLKLAHPDEPVKLLTLRIKTFGIILNIMTDSTQADMDHSNNISLKEALLLSIALNMDGIGAGLSIGLIGYSFLLVPISALIFIIAMTSGLYIGRKYLAKFNEYNGYFFTGLILIVLSLRNFI